MIGEASGYLDPAWGQGVYYHALQSGADSGAKTVYCKHATQRDQEYLRGGTTSGDEEFSKTAAAALRSVCGIGNHLKIRSVGRLLFRRAPGRDTRNCDEGKLSSGLPEVPAGGGTQ